MDIQGIVILAALAVAFMTWMLIRARRRTRAEMRADRLRSVVDHARSGVPLVHEADVGHDESA